MRKLALVVGALIIAAPVGAQDQVGNCPPEPERLDKDVLTPVLQAGERAEENAPDPLPALISNTSAIFGAAGLTEDDKPNPLFVETPTLAHVDGPVDKLDLADMDGDGFDDLVVEAAGVVYVFEGSAMGIGEQPSHNKTLNADQNYFEAALDIYIDLEFEELDLVSTAPTGVPVVEKTEDELLAEDLALAKRLEAAHVDTAPQLSYEQRMVGHRGPTADELIAFHKETYPNAAMSVADVDGDGLRDVFVALPEQREVRLHLGGQPRVAWSASIELAQGEDPPVPPLGRSMSWGDLNNDGAIDLVSASGTAAWVYYGTPSPDLAARARPRPKS